MATFSSIDGKLIRVPEHFVPKSMVEWDRVPSCLECIVSEDMLLEPERDGNGNGISILERNVVNIMPAVGCGVDNLDTMEAKDLIPLDRYQEFVLGDVKIATVFMQEKRRRVECIFMMNTHSANDDEEELVRTRVCCYLHDNNQLKSPIEITKERKTSRESSRGIIAKGGGLDARTVTGLVGKDNISRPFCDGEAMDLCKLDGVWTVNEETVERDASFWNSDASTSFSVPGNILVRNCPSPRSLEICLILEPSDAASLKRLVVQHMFDDTAQSSVNCYEELKVE